MVPEHETPSGAGLNVSRTVPPPAATTHGRRTARTPGDRLPHRLAGLTGYLVAGIFLGLFLIGALSIGRGGDANAAALPPSLVTDNVVHLHAAEIGNSCWQGLTSSEATRLTVALEIGIDGKIRYATANGESPAMRACVEAYVKAWEFLPQAQAQTMALPFEVDRR